MITNKAKELNCREYESYLKLIYWFGKGVMMSIHIQKYMEQIENKNKTQVWRDLRELQSKELVDVHKIHNNNYIKIKKYAVKFLLNKDSTKEVKSINYGFIAIKKSVFINELILRNELKGNSVDELKNYYLNNTTLINKDNLNSAIFNKYKENNKDIQMEMENLDCLSKQQLQTLKTKTKTQGKKIKKSNSFNLNNMQQRNSYIISISDDVIKIAFLDLNDSYTATKLLDVFWRVYDYISSLFIDKKLVFIIVVSDKESKERIKKENLRLIEMLQNKHIYDSFNVKVLNIDIRARVFGNVKILL